MSDWRPAGDGWVQVDETGYVVAAGMPRAYFEQAGKGKFFVQTRPPQLVLPTEAGAVIAIGDWWFVKNRTWMPGTNLERDLGWMLTAAPDEATLRSMERASFGFKEGRTYDNGIVLAEAEQEGGYRLIARPVGDES